MDYIKPLNKYSLRLSSYLVCKLYNIKIPFHVNINNMFRDEIIQYWIDNCRLNDDLNFISKYNTWELVQANPGKEWHYYCLSENPNITWEIVQTNPNKPWNYGQLSSNPNITWEIIQDNPDKKWDYWHLSYNPNITWEIVRDDPNDNPDREWSYKPIILRLLYK
jgi:hypothetical protein